MRVKKKKINLDYNKTRQFFAQRSNKYNTDNPYSVTMYQDSNKSLVESRNLIEQKKIIPLLELSSESKVLDISCGIGRWSDAIITDINSYLGIDFCEGLISIARDRNHFDNRSFEVGSTNDIIEILCTQSNRKVNRIICAGICIYLNEDDLIKLFKNFNKMCDERTIIYIREPIGIENRLTLKDFYSEELQAVYNAIYRTRDEYNKLITKYVLSCGFKITEEKFLFDSAEELNNRKETAQYYYILKR